MRCLKLSYYTEIEKASAKLAFIRSVNPVVQIMNQFLEDLKLLGFRKV